MSYHRALVLPQTLPMRDFANAYGPYAHQVRYVIPQAQTVPARPAAPPRSHPLGDSGDGLGALGRGLGTLVVL